MNKKYTSVPWLIKGDEVGCISNHDDQSFGMFCPVAIVTNQDSAGLIAAAPDLLEALELAEQMLCKQENAMRSMGCYEPCPEVAILTARAAIAKALGGKNE